MKKKIETQKWKPEDQLGVSRIIHGEEGHGLDLVVAGEGGRKEMDSQCTLKRRLLGYAEG